MAADVANAAIGNGWRTTSETALSANDRRADSVPERTRSRTERMWSLAWPVKSSTVTHGHAP